MDSAESKKIISDPRQTVIDEVRVVVDIPFGSWAGSYDASQAQRDAVEAIEQIQRHVDLHRGVRPYVEVEKHVECTLCARAWEIDDDLPTCCEAAQDWWAGNMKKEQSDG